MQIQYYNLQLKSKWNNETCQYACENYHKSKENYIWNPSTCVWENRKYLKSIGHDSKIVSDEIINFMDIVSTNMRNTILTNATITISIKCHNKKVR